MNDIVWICGKSIPGANGLPGSWEFKGVFSTEDLAIAACKNDWHFIGPAIMDAQLPEASADWKGAYYPLCVNTLSVGTMTVSMGSEDTAQ